MTFKRTIMRRRLAALVACSMIAITVPLSATAEYGIPAGSGAVITAGQPLLVRTAPGWDAPVAFEIADGSFVTVWGAEQSAPDGSLWYPVDGGFVPAELVSSAAPADTGVALYQEAAPAESTEAWVEPATSAQGWIDPATGLWVDAAAPADGWVDPATGQWVQAAPAQDGWIDPTTGEWVQAQPVAQDGWIDPTTGEWVQAQPAQDGWVDPTTGEWVQAQTAQGGWVDPTTGEWVTETPAVTGWVDPNTGQLVEAAPVQQAAPAQDGWVDPATGQWVQAAPAQDGWVDPTTGELVAAAPAQQGWIDPATGQWVEPAAVATQEGWTDPTTGEWVSGKEASFAQEAATSPEGWVDPATGQWVQPAAAEQSWNGGDSFVMNTSAAPGVTNGGESWGEPIATAYISGTNGDGAVCRAAPEEGMELAVFGEGEPVEVRGEAVGAWQPVNCAGVGGYVNSSFVGWEAPASVEFEQKARGHADRNRNRGGGAGNDGDSSSSNGGGSTGGHVADFAMQYVGYPYAYAGEGPYAFDCSGFTKFVVQNTLGIDITHDMFTQIGMGQSIDQGSLQAGDLVFFANTFRPGLSHVGIYIGGGQFVHAENESTGVVVSELNSDYYGSRWAGGTRLA